MAILTYPVIQKPTDIGILPIIDLSTYRPAPAYSLDATFTGGVRVVSYSVGDNQGAPSFGYYWS